MTSEHPLADHYAALVAEFGPESRYDIYAHFNDLSYYWRLFVDGAEYEGASWEIAVQKFRDKLAQRKDWQYTPTLKRRPRTSAARNGSSVTRPRRSNDSKAVCKSQRFSRVLSRRDWERSAGRPGRARLPIFERGSIELSAV